MLWISPMVMQHSMAPPLPPQFVPPHFYGFHPPIHPPPSPMHQMGFGAEENTTIWVGDPQYDGDSITITVFVGGLDPNVCEDEPKQIFSKFGDIASVKVPAGKQCGFVQFLQRNNAESTLQALNETLIGKQIACLSWDRQAKEKEMESVPLSTLYADVISAAQISQGFIVLLQFAEDLVVDILDAVDVLALFIVIAVVDDILPPAKLKPKFENKEDMINMLTAYDDKEKYFTTRKRGLEDEAGEDGD